MEGLPKQAFKPYEDMLERKGKIERDLAELRGWSVEVGEMHHKATDDKNPTSREELKDMTERADDLAERAQEKQRDFEQSSPQYGVKRHVEVVEQKASTASMAMPQLP